MSPKALALLIQIASPQFLCDSVKILALSQHIIGLELIYSCLNASILLV